MPGGPTTSILLAANFFRLEDGLALPVPGYVIHVEIYLLIYSIYRGCKAGEAIIGVAGARLNKKVWASPVFPSPLPLLTLRAEAGVSRPF